MSRNFSIELFEFSKNGTMTSSLHRPAGARRFPFPALVFICVAPLAATAMDASDSTPEREDLAALTRQLDMVDRLAAQAAASASQEPARYHFDYARLRADVARVRAGVQDYLAPQRAQPRDPLPLSGDYARDASGRPEAP